MKNIPKWVLFAGLGGVAYLLFKNSAGLRQDLYKTGAQVSRATGGRVPNVAAGVLPNVTPDPGFGVSYPMPDWLTTPWTPNPAFANLSSTPTAYAPPAFGVGVN